MENGVVVKKKLDCLSPETQEGILEMAARGARLADILQSLRGHGVDVSLSTLTRFVRERVVFAEGEGMKAGAEALAAQGSGDVLRKGTLQAVRQKIYEEALSPISSSEETRKLYGELLKEEARLKELELAERKLQLEEEKTRLQKVRLRLTARGMGGRKRIRLDAVNVVEGVEVKAIEGPKDVGGKRLSEALGRVEEILNRGGAVEERLLEARAVVGEAKALEKRDS